MVALPVIDDAGKFEAHLVGIGHSLLRTSVHTMQINIGRVCNQACLHCHVEAGPKRTETMSARTADKLIELMATTTGLKVVDITGGAPEMNREFRRLVRAARKRGRDVIDRCNLTILCEPGQQDLAHFLAENRVRVVASLPCYSQGNVDAQRGKGVFESSITGLKQLNAVGYGHDGSGRTLDLIYNPGGAFLPPPQADLEASYKAELGAAGIVFNSLLTITNMPIGRFAHDLARDGQLAGYQRLLVDNFNVGTLDGLMCKTMVSISYDGKLYDCDFNQMLNIEAGGPGPVSVWDLDSLDQVVSRKVATRAHCFGCTAGAGSSCGGALS